MRKSRLHIQLLTFDGCPLAASARAELEAALAHCGSLTYEEIDILDAGTAEPLRAWGSPTILIDGADVTGQARGDNVGCRIYPGDKGVPEKSVILAAIERRLGICQSGTNAPSRE